MDDLTTLLTGGGVLLTIVIIAVSSICSLLPFALIGWYIYRQYRKSKVMEAKSQSWASAAGIIVKSRVEVGGTESNSVSPKIVYEYVVGGVTYQNDNIRPGDDFLRVSRQGSAYDIVDQYPVGMAVIVYYNPANPAESSLER